MYDDKIRAELKVRANPDKQPVSIKVISPLWFQVGYTDVIEPWFFDPGQEAHARAVLMAMLDMILRQAKAKPYQAHPDDSMMAGKTPARLSA